MSIGLSYGELTDLYKGKARFIRTQHCTGCKRPLAVEVTNKLGFGGEYWLVSTAQKCKGEIEHLFMRTGRWFGNRMKCPTCGREGFLPMDKPLNWEPIQKKTKEGRYAIQSN